MSRDVHERARELIALIGTEDLSAEGQLLLQSHLRECAACRNYEAAAGSVIRALRAQPLTTDAALVRAAQRRVRARIIERQERQEQVFLVSLSCLLVGLLATVTTALLCESLRWMGIWADAPNWVWGAGFTFASVVPALLASGVLLARGTHLPCGVAKVLRQEGI